VGGANQAGRADGLEWVDIKNGSGKSAARKISQRYREMGARGVDIGDGVLGARLKAEARDGLL
jgi:hypothetical protein